MLSSCVVPASQLQTHALACLLIASKQFERYPLGGRNFSVFADICDVPQLHTAELNTLYRLGWDVNSFTPTAFVKQLLQLISHSPTAEAVSALSQALCELALSDFSLVGAQPSAVGTAAVAIACRELGLDIGPLVNGLAERHVSLVVNEAVCAALVAARQRAAAAAEKKQQPRPRPQAGPAASDPASAEEPAATAAVRQSDAQRPVQAEGGSAWADDCDDDDDGSGGCGCGGGGDGNCDDGNGNGDGDGGDGGEGDGDSGDGGEGDGDGDGTSGDDIAEDEEGGAGSGHKGGQWVVGRETDGVPPFPSSGALLGGSLLSPRGWAAGAGQQQLADAGGMEDGPAPASALPTSGLGGLEMDDGDSRATLDASQVADSVTSEDGAAMQAQLVFPQSPA